MDRTEFETVIDMNIAPASGHIDSDKIPDGFIVGEMGDGMKLMGALPIKVKPLRDIDSMDGYLGSYGKILGLKAIDALSPLHVPDRDPVPDFSDIPLGRKPFDCQQHVIAATGKMLNRVGSGFIVGEMGTGKSLMGAVGVDRHARKSRNQGGKGGNYRALILAPDHLIGKWCREIEETIPDARATRFGTADEGEVSTKKGRKSGSKPESGTRRTLRDIVALLDGRSNGGRWPKPRGAEWFVLGRNQAKWLSDWVGIADLGPRFSGQTPTRSQASKTTVIDKVYEKNEFGRVIGSKNVLARVYVCPKCGNKLVDKKGVPVAEKDFSSKTKGATQKNCRGAYAVEIPDPEKPRGEGLDRLCPLPDRFAEKRPADPASGRPADTFPQGGRRYKVMSCNEPLYNYVAQPYRWSPARIIQKKMKRFFDYLVIDEVHEQKSDSSAQSMACGKLISSAKHTIALTGTIIGGYADHLYPLMMRITPKSLRAEGFEWGKDLAFSEVYGKIDTVTRTTEEAGSFSVAGNSKSMRKAKTGDQSAKKYVRPGVMPTMFGRHLLGSSMFITLDEMASELPDLFEYIGGPHAGPPERGDFDIPGRTPEDAESAYESALDLYTRSLDGWFETAVDMLPNQEAEYKRIKAALEAENQELLQTGSMKLLGAYLWTTMDYPDKPYGWGHDPEVKKAIAEAEAAISEKAESDIEASRLASPVGHGMAAVPIFHEPETIGYWKEQGNKHIDNWVGVVTPEDLSEDVIYPKEQALIDICKKQKKDGSQTWVYVQMTGKRNIQPRLKKLLEAEGLKVGVLRSTDVEPIEREAWIAKNGRTFDVMISHPQLVSTGLDLFSKAVGGHNYSTLVFYETGYNLFTMRQAARRAWRIGQPHDCRVYYLYYRDTMQHNAMSLMSRKMAAAQALEGEFSEDGLAAMAGEDNMQMALAKSLADRIDDSDIQRSWSKVKSNGSKKPVHRPGDAMKQAADHKPSPFDGLPTELQLIGEELARSVAKKKLAVFSETLGEFNANPAPTMADGLKLDEARINATAALVQEKAPVSVDAEEEAEDEPDFFTELGDKIDEFEVYEDHDDDFVMPDLTEEALAKMFAQMAESSGW